MQLASLRPPAPATGFSHTGCYLHTSNDCSAKLSREHYISKALMKGEGLKVRGMPWWPGEARPVSADALTAKILCQRHNAALSPLDAEAERAFLALEKAIGHASRKSLSRRTAHYLISGEALELWAMKTMAGLAVSGIDFMLGEHRVRDYLVPMDAIISTLTSRRPVSRVMMSIPAQLDRHEPALGRRAVSIGPMLDPDDKRVKGLLVRMHGLTLDFGFDFEPEDGAMVRPDIIDFHGPRRSARAYVGWSKRGGSGLIAEVRLANPRRNGRPQNLIASRGACSQKRSDPEPISA